MNGRCVICFAEFDITKFSWHRHEIAASYEEGGGEYGLLWRIDEPDMWYIPCPRCNHHLTARDFRGILSEEDDWLEFEKIK